MNYINTSLIILLSSTIITSSFAMNMDNGEDCNGQIDTLYISEKSALLHKDILAPVIPLPITVVSPYVAITNPEELDGNGVIQPVEEKATFLDTLAQKQKPKTRNWIGNIAFVSALIITQIGVGYATYYWTLDNNANSFQKFTQEICCPFYQQMLLCSDANFTKTNCFPSTAQCPNMK